MLCLYYFKVLMFAKDGKMFLSFGQKLPVTAVTKSGNFLFSAQGKCIEVIEVSASNHKVPVTKVVPLLNQSSIHALKTFTSNGHLYMLAFGGKELCLATHDCFSAIADCQIKVFHKSLLHDWILDVTVLNNNEKKFELAIALAHNSLVIYDWKSSQILKEVHCNDKCILYSACFINFSGSSYQDLLMCSGTVFNQIIIWKPSEEAESGKGVLKRLNGHDGVIFDICFNYEKQLLLSASDDRSIRVWSCSFLTNADKLKPDSESCLCVMYGHEARIWKVESFLKDDDIFLVSVAEDGYCILWKLSRDDHGHVISSIVKKMGFRANLLSLSKIVDDQFVIGGCDGSIRVLSLNKLLRPQDCIEAPAISTDEHGSVKSVSLLRKNKLAVLSQTDRGSLLLYWIDEKQWKVLDKDELFGSYVVMKKNMEETYVALGNTKGLLKLLHINCEYEIVASYQYQVFSSKVLSVNWSDSNVFVSGPDGKLLWFYVGYDGCNIAANLISSFVLPPAKHRWSTVVILHPSFNDMFICGDRRGCIHFFKKGQANPLQTFHGIHGKLGVTSLHVYDSTLISTGRDGHWRSWLINKEKLSYLNQHRSAQGMDWLEGCDVMEKENLYIYGFHGNKFIVWSRYSGDELFSLQCGGGHRSWDFSLQHSCLVFLKAGKLNVALSSSPIKDELLASSSLHSQHINCVRHLINYKLSGKHIFILATAGEDTKVILSSVEIEEALKRFQVQTHEVLDDHLSNVRCVATLTLSNSGAASEVLMITGGGRAMMHLYFVKIKKNSNIVTQHLTSYTSGDQESETRLMSISLWMADNHHYMAVACSDGRIRLFEIQQLNNVVLLGETKEYNHCFLTVSHLDGYLFCGSTNGYVYVFSTSLDEVTSYLCHQSGVNSLALSLVTVNNKDLVLSATGGDDNAIFLRLLSCCKNISFSSFVNLKNAHSAQITSLHLEKVSPTLFHMSSVSIDQRIIRWKISVSDVGSLKCDKEGCVLTSVSDVASMSVCGKHHFICGQGLAHYLYAPGKSFVECNITRR